jgi:hypothetical protein
MRTDRANSGPAGRALTKIFAHRVGHLLPLLRDPANVRLAYALVDLGRPGTEEALVTVLMRHGDVTLAEYYLNCGNNQLERAAHRWAAAHGYTVTQMPGVPGNEWGSGL